VAGPHHPFKSKAQWRYFFSNPRLRRFAHEKAHATPGGPVVRYRRLPRRKGRPAFSRQARKLLGS
jgi:hypothetical protein